MKKTLFCLSIYLLVATSYGQLCPGGGLNFANSATFDQTWISGCKTKTSCNGGISFDNRTTCQPDTLLDPCAPAPSCTSSTNGSDLWFKFYAMDSSVSINIIPEISFIPAIQAFKGGPSCSTINEIGCTLSNSPTSGTSLSLSGLKINTEYYFRVFGSASTVSQRTGNFCFCGTTGLSSSVLPIVLTSFKGLVQQNKIVLIWQTSSELNSKNFEVQHSIDAINFTSIGIVPAKGTSSIESDYSLTDFNPWKGTNYYRLKQVDINNGAVYSIIITEKTDVGKTITVTPNIVKDNLIIQSTIKTQIVIINENGQSLQFITILPGKNEFSITEMPAGIYLLRSQNNETQKFFVTR